jgi:hypothetical protein
MTTLTALTDAQARIDDWSQREDALFRRALREAHDQVCDGDEDCNHYEPREG